MDTKTLTIKSFIVGLRAGSHSAVDAVKNCLDAVRSQDGDIHAYLETYGEEALTLAARADAEIREGNNAKALLGVPVALKDNMLVAEHRATAGS